VASRLQRPLFLLGVEPRYPESAPSMLLCERTVCQAVGANTSNSISLLRFDEVNTPLRASSKCPCALRKQTPGVV
jgi:hypothetical protein